jgi:hypothetical protein
MPLRPSTAMSRLKFKAENTIFDWTGGKTMFILLYNTATIARPDSTYRRRCEVVEGYVFCF